MKELDYKNIFEDLPGIYLILDPNPPQFTILAFNKARAKATISDSSIIGKNLFEIFSDDPDNPSASGVPNLKRSLMKVMETKKPHEMAMQRYDLYNSSAGKFEERYWLPQNIPVIDEENNIVCIIHAVEDVTDKVRLTQKEGKIKKEVERLHLEREKILESVGEGFISVSKDWKVTYWNKSAEKIFNIKRNDIIGKDLGELVKDEPGHEICNRFYLTVNKNESAYFETFYEPTKVWLQISAFPSEYGMTAFLMDITERKKAEQVLERNERKFRAIVEHISDGIVTISQEGVVKEISASGNKILGYTDKKILGRNWEEIIHPADKKKIDDAFQTAIKSRESSKIIEFRFLEANKAYKWVEGSFHNLLHEETIEAIILYFRDIAKRKQHQEQLITSEEKYRYLFENSPATKLVWTLDDLKIREVNQTAVNNFGYTRDELLNMTALDIRPVEEHERFLNMLEELKNSSQPKNTGVWRYLKRNGESMYMNVSFHRINYADTPAVMVLATNVTEKVLLERKLGEERRKRQQDITEAVLAAQENERAELGKELHDNISQILTTARLYLEYVLSKKGDQTQLVVQSHEYITNAIGEIKSLSRNLLLPSLDGVSLKDALDDLFKNIKPLNKINLEFFYSVKNEEVISNRMRLAIVRIIQEQTSNILKHSQATEIIINIALNTEHLHLSMKDNGVGFDVRKVKPGLGLKNIRSRANLLGGNVDIKSGAGLGTELIVNFPIV